MTKKGQITVFVIAALVILFIISFAIYFINQNNSASNIDDSKVSTFSEMRININKYIQSCIEDNSRKYIEETGIREETKQQYIEYVEKSTKECADALFSRLKEQAYEINEGEVNANAEILDETITVTVDFPVTIEKNGQKTIVSNFFITIDRTYVQDIPNGKTKTETRIPSKDGRAELIIPPDVEIRDGAGNLVKKIGIKVEDRHFLGLDNGVVIGNLVYQGTPDGAQFSKPIEISIEIRDQDIPANYPKDALYIANWDEKYQVWRGVPTTLIGTRAYANITHFSRYSVSVCDDSFLDISLKIQMDNNLLEDRYNSIETDNVYEQKYYAEEDGKRIADSLFCPSSESNSNSYWSFNSQDRIVAKKANAYYLDNFFNFNYRDYGSNGEAECKCAQDPFFISIEAEEGSCNNDPAEQQQIYFDGKPCTNGQVLLPNPDTTKRGCTCQTPKKTPPKKGYCTKNCVGGKADAGDSGSIAVLKIKKEGNACVLSSRVVADCNTLPANKIVGGISSQSLQDECSLIPYTGLKEDQAKELKVGDPKADGHLELQVRGVGVKNTNNDACAAAKVKFSYIGFGVDAVINNNKKTI